MKNIFLIFGYGIPENILKDENYNFYLKIVFNRIFDITTKKSLTEPLIIFSGGKTDCFKPYARTEAGEMVKLFNKLKNRRFVHNTTQDWRLVLEKKSLSTLENLLFTKNIIKSKRIQNFNLYILCEQKREKRAKALVRNVFGKKNKAMIIPIDFDTSKNRYLSKDFIREKEKRALRFDLWALKNSGNFKKYHQFYQDKLKFFRQIGPDRHAYAVKK